MNMNSFPIADIPVGDVDLPPDKVFVASVRIVGKNSYLIENPEDIQSFIKENIEEKLPKASVVKTKEEAKTQLDCKIAVCPVHKSRVPTELLQANTEYSSIVLEFQLSQLQMQEGERCHRQPLYEQTPVLHIEPNQEVTSYVKECIRNFVGKLTNKK